ncbi:hypothetical protein [Streptomyces sp. NPDC001494]
MCSRTPKTAGSRTWRPTTAYRLGASSRDGFCTSDAHDTVLARLLDRRAAGEPE